MTQKKYINATKYEETPQQIKNREARNRARYDLEKQGRVKKGDHVDVGHKIALDNNKAATSLSNVAPQSVKSNRGWRKNRKGYSVPNL